ncbi:beta-1,3-galactosyltransferase 5-like [Erinaceus europaeus]|uniref:Hexosyltransferase n=1 Tax=Erinaceus europaeus TaxID=9365 RepID=A0A1S3AII6_ERIEU|nr:beta-1,3-galactosyltransferase 5-like [Erinaceus europaeus]
MTSLRVRVTYLSLVLLGALCLYFSMCNLSAVQEELYVFRRENGGFLQLPELDCEQNPPFLVLLVASAQDQALARSVIRGTWGRERLVRGKRIKTLFLLGAGPNKNLLRKVSQEGHLHRDIIQKDFVDTYYNLTLKTLMGMEWVHRFCPQAAFVMKTDTDMFVNVYYLTDLLLQKNRTAQFFTGFLKMNEFPIRKKYNKWFVSKFEYPWDKYPPFCSGTGYVFSSDIAGLVYNVSESVPFLKLEDVFVGLCLARLGVRPQPLHTEQTFFPEGLSFSPCRFRKVVACHFVRPQDLLSYWHALERSLGDACPGA